MTSDKTIVIVEGKSDTRRLKEIFPSINTFETHGLGLNDNMIEELRKFSSNGYELICFTDPDGPGEVIRKKINDAIENVYNAYVAREYSKSPKGKLGIESATVEEIQRALSDLKVITNAEKKYDLNFLIEHRLYGNKNRREKFCDMLSIANGNNKKVLKQLNGFKVSLDKVNNILEELEKDE